jgi:hypothetical protein
VENTDINESMKGSKKTNLLRRYEETRNYPKESYYVPLWEFPFRLEKGISKIRAKFNSGQ